MRNRAGGATLSLTACVLCGGACSLTSSLDDLQAATASNLDSGTPIAADAQTADVPTFDTTCFGACTLPNASTECVKNTCTIQACTAPFEDCDQNPATGCEADTQSSASACGGCGKPCSSPDGAAHCVNGACVLQCPAGFEDCNGIPSDGCEAMLDWDGSHCGGCGNPCGSGEACENGNCVTSDCSASSGSLRGRPNGDVDKGLWAASQGSGSYYTLVDNLSPDGKNTYIWDDTSAAPSYALFSHDADLVPSGLRVKSVIVKVVATLASSATGPTSTWPAIRIGSSNYDGASKMVSSKSSYVTLSTSFDENPATGTDWTAAEIPNLGIGVGNQHPSSPTAPVEVTQITLELCLESQ